MKKILFIKKILNTPARIANWILFLRKKICCRFSTVKIWGKLRITGNGKISIGEGVILICDSKYNPIAGPGEMHFSVMPNAKFSIGNGTRMTCCSIAAWQEVSVGKNVLIGANCMICDTDFHAISPEKRQNDDWGNTKVQPVRIDDNVFIGARSIILKGATIGEGAVIGAGSVVSGTIPPREIWAGNPAKFIKKVND